MLETEIPRPLFDPRARAGAKKGASVKTDLLFGTPRAKSVIVSFNYLRGVRRGLARYTGEHKSNMKNKK